MPILLPISAPIIVVTDVGATKIESVVLEENGQEKHRSRTSCPKDYLSIVNAIKTISQKLEKEFKMELPIGVCHPGIHSPQTGLVKNAPNCYWLEKKPFQNDLRKALGKEVFCENDANCFALSEAIDGSGKHYKIVYGIILGSGAGGGLVIDKQIISGPNGVAGEWGHNQIPYFAAKKENFDSNNSREAEIESFISGLGLAKRFNKIYGKNLKTNEIFELNRKHDLDAEKFIDDFIASNRMEKLSNVPTATELGIPVVLSTVRGFVTKKGVAGDRKKQLEDAMIKAMEHKYFQSFLTDIGLDSTSVVGADEWGKQMETMLAEMTAQLVS